MNMKMSNFIKIQLAVIIINFNFRKTEFYFNFL